MKINIILDAFMLFGSSMMLHIMIWRIRLPWMSSLMLILLLVGAPTVIGLGVMADIGGSGSLAGLNAVEAAEVLLLHLCLAGTYIAGYPAVRAVSPSLDILLMISASPDKHMREEEMLRRYADMRLVSARIDDLRSYRLLIERDGRYVLTLPARILARTFLSYRRLLGLSMGRG